MWNDKQEFYVTINIEDWAMEMKILKFFGSDIEIVDYEDPIEKNVYCELLINCEWEVLEKYMNVRKIMLS